MYPMGSSNSQTPYHLTAGTAEGYLYNRLSLRLFKVLIISVM